MFGLVSTLFTIISNAIGGYQKLQQAKIDTSLAIEQNKQRLAIDQMQYNANWEMASLADADKWLRRVCFVIFMTPLVWAAFSPQQVHNYFVIALAVIPTWYLQIVVSIVAAVWGISSLKNNISEIVSKIGKPPQQAPWVDPDTLIRPKDQPIPEPFDK